MFCAPTPIDVAVKASATAVRAVNGGHRTRSTVSISFSA